MTAASKYDLPFDIPLGLDPLDDAALQQTSLIEFYKKNQEDFMAVMSVRYFEITEDPDPGALTDRKKGFDSFCDLMTEYFLAAPSQTLFSSTGEGGHYVNFFGRAIMQHLGNTSFQELLAHDGTAKHGLAWMLVRAFVRYVVIDCFRVRKAFLRDESDNSTARSRIQDLREGKRRLILVQPKRVIFGKA